MKKRKKIHIFKKYGFFLLFFEIFSNINNMEQLLKDLIQFALNKRSTDIHFILSNHQLKITLRTRTRVIKYIFSLFIQFIYSVYLL